VIIQVRGTSGSGKSTAMRRIMKELGTFKPVYVAGKKRPQYYIHESKPVLVLGHYETVCGGCDYLKSLRNVYELVRATQPSDFVLCEGLLLSEDVKWTMTMAGCYTVRCIFLTTPIERCIERIRGRRVEAGNSDPLNTTNTVRRVRTIERARNKLLASGIIALRCSADQSVKIVLNWLREGDCHG
jgi:uridine kinase